MEVLPPNGARLSCGAPTSGRTITRTNMIILSEQTQFFPTCEVPPASSACWAARRVMIAQGRRRGLGGGQWRDQSSAQRFLHERAGLCLCGSGQFLQREGERPE